MGGSPFTSAALFDTRSEFARDLPLELIAAWLQRKGTLEAAAQLLRPHQVKGTTVASDSAGLTRLAREREPLEVMALINRPKELVHQCGVSIGGQAMGVWTADNTEMFYPESVGCDRIASMLLTVQDRLRAETEVQIGMAAHFDSFFLVGNALYGEAAVRIECLAEDRTAGGEIVLTDNVWKQIRDSGHFAAIERNGDGLRLLDGPRIPWPGAASIEYPFPFPKTFHKCLCDYLRHSNSTELRKTVRDTFARHCTVALVERAPVAAETTEASILGDMTEAAIAHTRGALLLASTSGEEVKTAGSLSLYVFEGPDEAWTFSMRLRKDLEAIGIRTRSGIASGEVLVFDLDQGGREISGSPINVASKIAQDCGEFGRVYVIGSPPGNCDDLSQTSFTVKGIEIPVWVA